MNGLTRKSWPVAFAAILLVPAALGQDRLPNIVVLATGGTVAGAASSDVQAAYTKAHVLLRLALVKQRPLGDIQRIFEEY